jgi:hypothetical protein
MEAYDSDLDEEPGSAKEEEPHNTLEDYAMHDSDIELETVMSTHL